MPEPANQHAICREAVLLPLIPLGVAVLLSLGQSDLLGFTLINTWASGLPDALWTALSSIGNGWVCLAIAIPLLQVAPRLFVAALYSGLFASITSQVLKHAIEKSRPAALLEPANLHIIGDPLFNHAMPSGHTLTAFTLASGLYFAITIKRRHYYRWFFLLAGLTGLARIAVGAHWPQDVAAGMAAGLFCGLAGAALTRWLHSDRPWVTRHRCPLALAAGFACVLMLAWEPLDFPIDGPFQRAGAFALALILLYHAIQSPSRRHDSDMRKVDVPQMNTRDTAAFG